jgi:hypothetical protein
VHDPGSCPGGCCTGALTSYGRCIEASCAGKTYAAGCTTSCP